MSTQVSTSLNFTLFDSYVQCVKSFAAFGVRIGSDEYLKNCTEKLDLENVLHEYGRLNIWGDQTKANLPPRARGSLDDTLRHDAKLKNLVLGILLRLNTLLEKGTEAATAKIAEATNTPDKPEGSARKPSSTATDDRDSNETDSLSGSDSDSDGEDEDELAISYMVHLATEQIRALYDLSVLLRRPTISSKYIRSIKNANKNGPVTEIMMLRRAFGSYEYNHIIEKVDQWRGQTKSSKKIDLVEEEAKEAGATEGPPHLGSCEDIVWLCHRLAEANMRRREQMEYWLGHPFDPKAHQRNTTILMPEIAVKDPAKVDEDGDKTKSEASRPQLAPVPIKEVASESQPSTQSKSIFAVSGIFDKDSAPEDHLHSDRGGGEEVYICPQPTEASWSGAPFPVSILRRHVFRDLRPYVCTFEQCQNAAKLYVNRNDWKYHELQVHRRQFICVDCDNTFPDRPSMGQHLKTVHYSGPMQQAQLPMLVDLCECQADDTHQDACIVCGKELALSELQLHLAAHMEDIALFALPTPVDAEGEESLASRRAAKSTQMSDMCTEDGTTDDDDTDVQPPVENQTGVYIQSTTDFANLLSQRGENLPLGITLP
ncbi:hypothetical protein B0T25DRAFT_602509 [Lasiosphaeria hispida]|uniref:C2H2-type domain-containing protein n=1 Tax=Lasiosphaeria hispida TaxID=260671 RepID=A0AAJ0MIW5_9PEZI|nr:hypothetical protein B0T25DRAFT_602509 [Lasiosphaeria hispida]